MAGALRQGRKDAREPRLDMAYQLQGDKMITQEDIDEYGKKIVLATSSELHAINVITNLMALRHVQEKNDVESPEEIQVGGILLVSGNSLVAAHFREVTGHDFDRDSHLIFPVTRTDLEKSVRSLAGPKTEVAFPAHNPAKLYAYVFYANGVTTQEVPLKNTLSEVNEISSIIAKKIHELSNGKEIEELLLRILKKGETNENNKQV
jgi:hypothetical protein